jgi:hypothetical protein
VFELSMETLTVTGIEVEDKNPAQLITTITSKARLLCYSLSTILYSVNKNGLNQT